MPISTKIEDTMVRASWIRKMFEEGIRLKQEYGAHNVYDFSLGNPILEPPAAVCEALKNLVQDAPAGLHRYMPNAGHPQVRESIAQYLSSHTALTFEAQDVVMTCGAAAGLNITLKALLNPGDQVVVVVPFFPEYRFYIDNHGGEMVCAESSEDFDLDLDALDQAINKKTKAVIINSPNNPTGRMYSAEKLHALGQLLDQKTRSGGQCISLISDEPYRKIVYDNRQAPDVFEAYANTIMVLSHSKDLGLAGERIGYAAISPNHNDRKQLSAAMTFVNRTLGFVNAPALFQQVVAQTQNASVPIEQYQQLRDTFYAGLVQAGLRCYKPEGAFYLFPKTPTADDMKFVQSLLQHRILAVPGAGFGRAGHIRLSFCVTPREVQEALPFFAKAVSQIRD